MTRREYLSGICSELTAGLETLAALPAMGENPQLGLAEKSADLELICEDAIALQASLFSQPRSEIRTIHHFACTGGTLIAKLVAAMPNAFVLSEVHPKPLVQRTEGVWGPTDIPLLARLGQVPRVDALTERLVTDAVLQAQKWLSDMGASLVLRDHTHSDFCGGKRRRRSTLREICLQNFDLTHSVVTVRHPADSYASLQHNGWVDFHPATFDEYCERYLLFLDAFDKAKVVRYEDVLSAPSSGVEDLAAALRLKAAGSEQDIFPIFQLTGASGRQGDRLSVRRHRPAAYKLQDAVDQQVYLALLNRLGYQPLSRQDES